MDEGRHFAYLIGMEYFCWDGSESGVLSLGLISVWSVDCKRDWPYSDKTMGWIDTYVDNGIVAMPIKKREKIALSFLK